MDTIPITGREVISWQLMSFYKKHFYMKWIKRILVIVLVIFILMIGGHLSYVYSMSADEEYPADSFLQTDIPKRALIVTAHDDDAYSLSGTVLQLVRDGWEVSQVSFKRINDPENDARFLKIGKAEGLKEVSLLDIVYRKDTSHASYMAFPYADFPKVFNVDTVYKALALHIERIRPTVIFSLDDVIGGYGHPDHVFMSQQVLEYCRRNKDQPGFTVRRVYQAVFPPSMAEAILVKSSWVSENPYTIGKKNYNCDGMPLPNVHVNIYDVAQKKKEYMNSFSAHDRKNIGKASPYYNWYPYWIYFRIFDKEYFRVLSFKE
ncbi:MAG: PIG-L family deacetylase [Chitinophagaceae bacterium]|nr:MAG: PIG-L family deacetylase [Chitinophagaceae bacterium]